MDGRSLGVDLDTSSEVRHIARKVSPIQSYGNLYRWLIDVSGSINIEALLCLLP
jgi:hypothetical protein